MDVARFSCNCVTQAEITALKLTFANSCCQFAAATMIFHDHMMTIAQEVQYVWGQRLSGAALIFLLNRYMVLTLGVAIILQVVPWDTPLSCEATILLYDVVSIALYIVIALFSALRAYAIGGRNWLAALTTLSLGLAIAVASMYFTAKSSYADVLVIEHMSVCNYTEYYSVESYNNDDNLNRIMSVVLSALIATRLCAVLADALLIGLTLHKTLKIQRTINPGTWAPLTKSLVKDGSLYFISLLFLNVLQMVLKSVNGALTNYVSVFVAPVSSILISWFMLNLRRTFRWQSMGFSAGTVGNMGEPLDRRWPSGLDDSDTSNGFEMVSSSLPTFRLRASDSLSLEVPIVDSTPDDIQLSAVP